MGPEQPASSRGRGDSSEGLEKTDGVHKRGLLAASGERQRLLVRGTQLPPDIGGIQPPARDLQRKWWGKWRPR
jgi:hypothetical protein